jgi:AbrB family looped-hinge helix DNA binding protein
MATRSTISRGRVVIPVALRKELGIQDNDQLVWAVRDGELVAITRKAQLRRAQELFSQYVPRGISLVDELIADRRAEQAKEDES